MKKHGDFLCEYKEFKLSDEQREKLHAVLLEMLCDIKKICADNGLRFMLCGGTLLGAIRHKGFIPWDDDVDIMMPREDYEKLHDAFKDNEKYFLEDPANCKCAHKMIKVMRRGTTYVEVGADNPDYPSARHVFIDIFPIDNMPKGKARFRAFRFNVAFHATSVMCERKYKSPIIEKACKTNKEMRKYYNLRYRIGAIMRLFGSYDHFKKVVLKLANYKKKTGYTGIPLGIAYNREKFKDYVLSEITETEFCDTTMPIPVHYDEYLKNLYGPDYMMPPPPEKRGSHAVAEFKTYIESGANND